MVTPAKWSLESALGTVEEDQNFVTVRAGYYPSNMSFPDIEDYDEFIVADCKAIGNGGKFYQIVNEADLETSLVRFEIQANSGVDIFENYDSEEACLYAYRVEAITSDVAPNEYPPIALDGENITYYLQGASPNWYVENPGDLGDFTKLPGVSIDDLNSSNPIITIPNYLVDCHELAYIDDPNYQGNWTDFFNGVRMRFDNALRNQTPDQSAATSEVYSYPDSTVAWNLTREDELYGWLKLKYFNNFYQKPAYDYEIELFNYPVDYAIYNTTDINDAPGEYSCGTTFSTPLPFKIKNLITEEYVQVIHNDKGIWNGEAGSVPSWFDGNANDFSEHPGSGDCVWSPGERLTFVEDVAVGSSQQTSETFELELFYEAFTIMMTHTDLCSTYLQYDQSLTYPAGICVYHEGMSWLATTLIEPSDNFIPNEWYDDAEPSTELNNNPWQGIYPWAGSVCSTSSEINCTNDNECPGNETCDGIKIVIKPVKWYVDGDFWVADMSLLGAADPNTTQDDLSEIKVVPNPYLIHSAYNENFQGKQIRFTHLPQQCKISIFTASGELVDVINHGGESNFDGNHFWDLKNAHGRDVAPGLYIYKVETPSGASVVNKFVIIR